MCKITHFMFNFYNQALIYQLCVTSLPSLHSDRSIKCFVNLVKTMFFVEKNGSISNMKTSIFTLKKCFCETFFF